MICHRPSINKYFFPKNMKFFETVLFCLILLTPTPPLNCQMLLQNSTTSCWYSFIVFIFEVHLQWVEILYNSNSYWFRFLGKKFDKSLFYLIWNAILLCHKKRYYWMIPSSWLNSGTVLTQHRGNIVESTLHQEGSLLLEKGFLNLSNSTHSGFDITEEKIRLTWQFYLLFHYVKVGFIEGDFWRKRLHLHSSISSRIKL